MPAAKKDVRQWQNVAAQDHPSQGDRAGPADEPGTAVSADVPHSAWFIDGTGAAIQIFDCSGLLCGRIIWLHKAHDAAGQLAHDNKNPDPAFRRRLLCGLTILQRPTAGGS
jgi:hypothetical protein